MDEKPERARWYNNLMLVFIVGYLLAVGAVVTGFVLAKVFH